MNPSEEPRDRGAAAETDRLLERARAGERRALARLLSLLENSQERARAILGRVYGATGGARVVGVTGPPGVGKSCLVDRLVAHYREAGSRVAVVAVDPSSPFTGGAILGDRIRMSRHFTDPGVFIRSMATRGHLGGLAAATADAVDLLDWAGFQVVLVETIGVGQEDVELVRVVPTTVLVLAPGLGDEVQALKSGIMEIGDLYVINKADLPGAERVEGAVRSALELSGLQELRPVLRVSAATGDGVGELAPAVEGSLARLGAEALETRRRDRARHRIGAIVRRSLLRRFELSPGGTEAWREAADRVSRRQLDPYGAAGSLLEGMGLGERGGASC